MVTDSVAGVGIKLMLNIDWRTLGIDDIGVAADWQDHVVRMWEAYAESIEFQADARRLRTFSELFALATRTDFVDGETISVIEMKPGVGAFQTCLNMIDVDRLSNPQYVPDTPAIRGGIERAVNGEPFAYYIRNGPPHDAGLNTAQFTWQKVPRMTGWGRPIVNHTMDHERPEQTRGVSEFASAIRPFRMLEEYQETELSTAITQSAFAAVIKTELDWTNAAQVLGGQAANLGEGNNKMVDLMTAAMSVAADYHKERNITFRGGKIPHLMPNEELDVLRSTHPNSNFEAFEAAFIRHLAAGLSFTAPPPPYSAGPVMPMTPCFTRVWYAWRNPSGVVTS